MDRDNKRQSFSILKRIAADVGKDRKTVGFSWCVTIIAKACLAVSPIVSGKIIDMIAGGSRNYTQLVLMCVVLAAMLLVGYFSDGVVGIMMLKVSRRFVMTLKELAQRKLNKLPIKYLDSHPAGDILSRLTVDMTNLAAGFENAASDIIGQFVLFICVVTAMFVTEWKLALIYIVLLPLSVVALSTVLKHSQKYLKLRNEENGALSAEVADSIPGHTVIKAFGSESNLLKIFDCLADRYYKTNVKAQVYSGMAFPVFNFTANLEFILRIVISGWLMIRGNLTIGEFQAFMIYGNMLLAPLLALGNDLNILLDGMSCASRIYELLDEEEEHEKKICSDDSEKNVVRGAVSFEHVDFRYNPDVPLMNDVSFEVKPGMTVAVVGPTGAGKTTLINLLMRFYDCSKGEIKIDGISVFDMTRDDLRRKTGVVLQESWIFNGTVAENIAYGKPDAKMEEIINASRVVKCDSFINTLPDGYNTRINMENPVLSGGQMQLISMARAVLADRPILILDEATSQVDTKTEYVLTKAMETLMKNRTCFIIAHRLFTIKNADKILYMENGDIKEIGNHEELMKLNGKYAALYRDAAD